MITDVTGQRERHTISETTYISLLMDNWVDDDTNYMIVKSHMNVHIQILQIVFHE
jgi:hypothetical protein